MATDCTGCRKSIDRFFVQGGSTRLWRRIHEHLGTCEPCRDYYDRVALASRALGGKALPRDSREAIAAEVISRTRATGRLAWLARPWAYLPAAATAAAVLVLSLTVLRPGRGPVGFAARGTTGGPAEGFRVFCLDADGRVIGAAAPQAELRCPLRGSVQVAYTAAERGARYFAAVGIDQAGRVLWYHGPPGEASSVAMRAGALDEPLPRSIRLDVNHHPGLVVVYGIFTDRPLGPEAISRDVAGAIAERRDLPPMLGAWGAPRVESLTLEVTP